VGHIHTQEPDATKRCTCSLDWRALRMALGLTQERFARLLDMSETTVKSWENRGRNHHCPHVLVVRRLRRIMRRPQWRAKLEASGYAYPYRSDFKNGNGD